MNLYPALQQALRELAEQHHLKDEPIQISCAALTVEQAIGNPEEEDYPIQKGREFLVEATFHNSRGQAFSCEGGNSLRTIADLCTMNLDTDRTRLTSLPRSMPFSLITDCVTGRFTATTRNRLNAPKNFPRLFPPASKWFFSVFSRASCKPLLLATLFVPLIWILRTSAKFVLAPASKVRNRPTMRWSGVTLP